MTADAAWMARFLEPAKLLRLAELPLDGWDESTDARVLGMTAAALAAQRDEQRELVARAADELIGELGLRAPVLGDGTVVALGDSITADALSWFEILRAVERRLGATATLVNAGISGETTADLRKRLRTILELRPARVLVLAGTNDCQRHGEEGALLVSAAETRRNLELLGERLAPVPAVIWLTPPLVDEAAVARSDALGGRGLAWRCADLRRVRETMRGLAGTVVDLQSLRWDATTLCDDGLHPSLAGQRAIARAVLAAG